MTIGVPWIGDCPPWHDRIPSHRETRFRACLDEVGQAIVTSAATEVIDGDAPALWHATTFRDFVPIWYYAGHYRQVALDKPCLNQNVHVSGIRGTPPSDTGAAMEILFRTMRRQLNGIELEWPLLSPRDRALRLAFVVANLVGGFIQIHPFINGNGRVSRMLWRWTLLRFGVPAQFLVHPRPDLPYAQLMAAAMQGDLALLANYVIQHLRIHPPLRD